MEFVRNNRGEDLLLQSPVISSSTDSNPSAINNRVPRRNLNFPPHRPPIRNYLRIFPIENFENNNLVPGYNRNNPIPIPMTEEISNTFF